MTFWEMIRAFVRFWPVLLIGVLATATAGLLVISDKGVYFTRTELVFLAPASTLYPNALQTQSEDIIITAGVVAKRVTGPGQVTKFASPDVTLVGMGVRDGWMLRLPDTGGQWAANFATQRLLLDIVASTREEVAQRQQELIMKVQTELSGLQNDADAPVKTQISVIAAPQSTVIYHVGGSRPRALAMTALLGAGLTIAAVVVLESRRRRLLHEIGRVGEHSLRGALPRELMT